MITYVIIALVTFIALFATIWRDPSNIRQAERARLAADRPVDLTPAPFEREPWADHPVTCRCIHHR